MAIEKKLIHFGKLADFEAQLTAGNILDRSIVFIQDAKKIWTHGTYYYCSEGTDVPDSVYVTDFTVNDLLNLVKTPDSVLSADFQSMCDAMVAHKVVLVPYDTSEGYAGYGIANGYREDMFYFSVKIEGGRCIEVEVNDYSQLRSDDLYIATYVREERLRTINGQTLLGDGDITVGGEDNVQSDWNVTNSSSDAYIKNKPTIPTKVSDLENDRELVDEQFARENFIGRSEDLSGMEVARIDQFLTPYGSLLYAFPDTANGDEDDVLLSRNTVKTINGESIVGSGDITISGGGSSGGSGAYSEVNHGTSDTTFALTPNTFHIWDEVANLTLTLGSETSGIANEFLFQFTSGATATSLTLPDDIKWANDAPPTIAENMIYQVSILKGMASVLEFAYKPKAATISFTVRNFECIAEEGMTWEQWVSSDYNTIGCAFMGNNVHRYGEIVAISDTKYVTKTDIIIGDFTYDLIIMT